MNEFQVLTEGVWWQTMIVMKGEFLFPLLFGPQYPVQVGISLPRSRQQMLKNKLQLWSSLSPIDVQGVVLMQKETQFNKQNRKRWEDDDKCVCFLLSCKKKSCQELSHFILSSHFSQNADFFVSFRVTEQTGTKIWFLVSWAAKPELEQLFGINAEAIFTNTLKLGKVD